MFPEIHLGPLRLDSYFTLMALALAIPLFYGPTRAKRLMPARARDFSNLLMAMYVCALIGFRIFHVIFELPGYYLAHPLAIFQFWKGGFVAYGGLFFALTSGAVFIAVKKLPVLITADALAAPVALVFAVARLGCFARGCCYGVASDAPWAVTFPASAVAPAGVPLAPTQLYLSAAALMVFLIIIFFERGLPRIHFPGLSAAIFLLLYPIARILVEFQRADFRGESLFGFSVSQWLSLPLMALGLWLLMLGKRLKE
jgi:phosphatidylglycerol:prolipoprotein diacylglycerol transferase